MVSVRWKTGGVFAATLSSVNLTSKTANVVFITDGSTSDNLSFDTFVTEEKPTNTADTSKEVAPAFAWKSPGYLVRQTYYVLSRVFPDALNVLINMILLSAGNW